MIRNPHQKITVYQPDRGWRKTRGLLKEAWLDFPQSWELGYRLTKRNLSAMYRQSLLGYFWSLIPPLFTALIWIALRGSNVVAFGEVGMPYPIFVFSGTLLWQVFSESVGAPLKFVSQSKSTLTKINFPRESLLVGAFLQTGFNSLIKLVLLAGVFVALQWNPGWSVLPGVVALLGLMFLGLSIGLWLVPAGMLYGDVSRGLGLVLQLGLYATPVIYPWPSEGLLARLMPWNPVAPVLMAARNLLTGAGTDYLIPALLILGFALILGVLGWFVYRMAMPIIIERIGS